MQEKNSLSNDPEEKTAAELSEKKSRNKTVLPLLVILSCALLFLLAFFLVVTRNKNGTPQPAKDNPTALQPQVSVDDYCQNNTHDYLLEEVLVNPETVCILRLAETSQVASLAAVSSHLTHVQTIYFNKNDAAIPPELGDLVSLTTLNFHHTVNTSLPPEIGKLKNLTILHMSKTDIEELPPEVGDLQNLTSLTVRLNAKPVIIPQAIAKLPNLNVLTIWGNPGVSLPESFSETQSIEYLDLTNNKLTEVPPAVYPLHRLKILNLSRNKISSIAVDIGMLTELRALRLDNNNLAEVPALGTLRHLETLTLNNNKLTKLPEGIETLEKLQYLNLSGNKINKASLDMLKQKLPNAQIVH